MSSAPKYEPRYLIADYEQWEGDWELWNGIPVSMSPSPGFRHQSLAARLVAMVLSELDKHQHCRGCEVVAECDWHVSENTVVRPDVFLTCNPPSGLFPDQPPVFIAEILSPATAHKDRTAKRDLYEAEGVLYYAMVDPLAETSELLFLHDGRSYQPLDTNNRAIELKFANACSIEIDFRELFKTR